MKTAIVVLTRNGLALARRLRDLGLEDPEIFAPSCVLGHCGGPGPDSERPSIGLSDRVFATPEPGIFGWVGPLRAVFPAIWEHSEAIVAVMALGIVVRLAGPLAADKRRDPGVVVVDDAGRFAISVLGGHGREANELAHRVAAAVGAMPVVTTASDSQQLPPVDRIGRALGWTLERAENLGRVAAAVVRRETVAVWQDAGSPDWWLPFGPWPAHFVRLRSWDELSSLGASALLVISDRVEPLDVPPDRTIVYRPPTLVAGIGCRRGTTAEVIDAMAVDVFSRHGLARNSLSAVATVTLKADEPGLLAFAKGRGIPVVAFPPADLDGQPGIETPSDRVRSKIGIAAVAEPAALRAAGASQLLVAKQKRHGVTLALARKVEAPSTASPSGIVPAAKE